MGGGVSSLPAEVTLAEAKELAGARWQPAWEEKFASKDLQGRGNEVLEGGQGAISEELSKAHSTNRSGVAEALDFSAIIAEKRGQHLPGTREWVFEAVLRWRTDADSAKLFLARRWRRHGQERGSGSARADCSTNRTRPRGISQAHRAGAVRASGAVAVSGGHAVRDGEGFEDALKKSAGVETDKVDELFEALIAKPLRSVEGAATGGRRPCIDYRRARRAAPRRAQARAIAARDRAQDAAAVDQDRRGEPRRGAN